MFLAFLIFKKLHNSEYFFKLHPKIHFFVNFSEILICCRKHAGLNIQKPLNIFFDFGPEVGVFQFGIQNFDFSQKNGQTGV